MTRKDYILLANALNKAKPLKPGHKQPKDAMLVVWAQCVSEIVKALTGENPQFEPTTFINACTKE